MRKIGGIWKSAMFIKGSLIIGMLGAYISYENNGLIKEAEYNLFEKNQRIEESYFPDPPGLTTVWKSNDKGNIESYLEYDGDGSYNKKIHKSVSIREDLLPSEKEIFECLEKRIKHYSKKELNEMIHQSYELFESIYDQLKFINNQDES